jgi:hypothetical protein
MHPEGGCCKLMRAPLIDWMIYKPNMHDIFGKVAGKDNQ